MALLKGIIVGLVIAGFVTAGFVTAGFVVAAATIGDAVVLAGPGGPQTFVLVGEAGAPACAADPCDGLFCVLQGEPAASCTCQ